MKEYKKMVLLLIGDISNIYLLSSDNNDIPTLKTTCLSVIIMVHLKVHCLIYLTGFSIWIGAILEF